MDSVERFALGMTFGADLALVWGRGRTGEALEVGRILSDGCLDAPDEIPAGGWRSEFFGDFDDGEPIYGIGPIMAPRELPPKSE